MSAEPPIPEPPSNAGAGIRYLRLPEVLARIGVGSMTIRRWEAKGQFPQRHKLGPKLVGWVEADVNAWCATRGPSYNGGPTL